MENIQHKVTIVWHLNSAQYEHQLKALNDGKLANVQYFKNADECVDFITFPSNTNDKVLLVMSNQLYQASFIAQSSISTRLLNVHQTPSISLRNVSFGYKDRSRCFDNSKPSRQTLSKIIRHNKLINYLGFLLRSHSLFYCSVQ
ncbi:unnamed protein product, partial [Rotaria sp. Silwood2]